MLLFHRWIWNFFGFFRNLVEWWRLWLRWNLRFWPPSWCGDFWWFFCLNHFFWFFGRGCRRVWYRPFPSRFWTLSINLWNFWRCRCFNFLLHTELWPRFFKQRLWFSLLPGFNQQITILFHCCKPPINVCQIWSFLLNFLEPDLKSWPI